MLSQRLPFLESAQCVTQVTAAGPRRQRRLLRGTTPALFTALSMLRHPTRPRDSAPTTAAPHKILDMENRFDITGEADDPEYIFAVRRPVNQEKAKIHGWELGGQYFFGDTGFGLQANYTIVNGDVGFNNNAPPGTTQFALLGLSDTANAMLMYEKYGITARLAYNWRDEFLAATNQNGSNTNPYYVEAYDQIDLSVGYDFNDSLVVSGGSGQPDG
jgi:TonB-dependent receptor